MLKSYETINGTLLLFSASATAKHYATCQLIHSSHLIDRYIVTWVDKELMFVNICFAQQSLSFVCMILLVFKSPPSFSDCDGDSI
jgi:hypothetical protein